MHEKLIKTAVIQLNTGQNIKNNLENFKRLITEAASAGATFITTPEVVNFITSNHEFRLRNAASDLKNEFIQESQDICKKFQVWILIGSLVFREKSSSKCFNRSFLIAPNGEIVSVYDKIHMFDVNLGSKNIFKESDFYQPGFAAVATKTNFATIGQTICYDLRFSHLFNVLTTKGAEIITVPSAFTRITGEKHWEVLLRARAIEYGVFIIAPAQCGLHDGTQRESYGHSCIISPSGEILTMMDNEVGFAITEIDLAQVNANREAIPNLMNKIAFE